MNKINIKNEKEGILWEGFKKEIPWMLFWILLGGMVYGYYQDKQICDEVLADPCGACQKIMNSDYTLDPQKVYVNISINNSLIPFEDKNPNDRTISNK